MNKRGKWEVTIWFRGDGKERPFRQRTKRCPKCKGSGDGSGCHEQGGWISGLCPECNGHGFWSTNSEPVPGSRWRKTKRAEKAVRRNRDDGFGGLKSSTMFTDPELTEAAEAYQ
jgi:hypothetical protein